MRQFLTRLQRQWLRWLALPLSNEETALQKYRLDLILGGLIGAGIIEIVMCGLFWALNIVPAAGLGALIGLGVQPLYGLAYWLGSRGRVRLAGHFLVWSLFLLMVGIRSFSGLDQAALLGFAIVSIVAHILLGLRAAAACVLFSTAAYGAIGWLQSRAGLPWPVSPPQTLGADVMILAWALIVIGLLWESATRHSQTFLQRYLKQLQYQGQELEAAYEEKARLMQELETRTREYIGLMESLQRPSVSLIPVTDEISILPLAGNLDAERMEQITFGLLKGVADTRARVLLLDLSAISRLGLRVVERLVEAVHALRLLGCELFLVGLPPRVAEGLADQEPLLRDTVILGDLQEGVAWALAMLGRRIVALEGNIESSLKVEMRPAL